LPGNYRLVEFPGRPGRGARLGAGVAAQAVADARAAESGITVWLCADNVQLPPNHIHLSSLSTERF